MPGDSCPGGNYSGAIVWWVKVRGEIVLGAISWGVIVRGTVVQAGIAIEPKIRSIIQIKSINLFSVVSPYNYKGKLYSFIVKEMFIESGFREEVSVLKNLL